MPTITQRLKSLTQTTRKPSAWVCPCGCVIPKKGEKLSGGPSFRYGFHVHCPVCLRVVAQFVDPKETQ